MLTIKQFIENLQSEFGSQILQISKPISDQVFVSITSDALIPIVKHLKNHYQARFLINIGTDEVQLKGVYIVSYVFSLDVEKLFICVQVQVDKTNPCIQSISQIIPGASWTERENQDLLGIKAIDHPDPRRLILPDDWPKDMHPLRKDFPHNYRPPSSPESKVKLSSPPEGSKVIPIGPFFPVLEEPAYFKVFVDGETVTGCDYRGFYSHRGIEKLGTDALTYNQVCFIAERICGICGFIHSTCYCQAVELAGDIEVPERAKYIRTVMLELERIHSHLLWLGIAGHIIGFDTILMQVWRVREPVMWLCEKISGNRKTYGLNLIGGVRRDISAEVLPELLDVIFKIEKDVKRIADAIMHDATLNARLKNVGILTQKVAKDFCVLGPTIRGSGIGIDARVDHPYAAYNKLGCEVCIEQEGDCWARTIVRIRETIDSVRIISTAISEMPDGPIMAKFTDIPVGREAISVVEAPRGEAIHYIMTGDNNRLYRWRVRAPTFQNLQAIPAMIKSGEIADVPITIGSIDPCFSCTERMIVLNTSKKSAIYNANDLLKLSREKTERMRKHMDCDG